MDPSPERGEWTFVTVDTGSPRVKTIGGLKKLEWCAESWGFVSKEVCWHDYGLIDTSIQSVGLSIEFCAL